MAFLPVQTAQSIATGATTVAATFGSPTTVGNLIFVETYTSDPTNQTVSSVTDDAGNTYAFVTNVASSTRIRTDVYFASGVPIAANTITVTFSTTTVGLMSLVIREYSITGYSVDVSSTSSGNQVHAGAGSIDVNSGNTGSTANAIELVVGFGSVFSLSGTATTAPTGTSIYSNFFSQTTVITNSAIIEDLNTSVTGVQNADYTISFTGASTTYYTVGVVAFKTTMTSAASRLSLLDVG